MQSPAVNVLVNAFREDAPLASLAALEKMMAVPEEALRQRYFLEAFSEARER